MTPLNKTLKAIKEQSGAASSVGLAILCVLGQPSSEGELLDRLDTLAEEAKKAGVFQELDAVIRFGDEKAKIEDLVQCSEWWDEMDRSVLDMQAHSNCGADCLSLIIRADAMLGDMLDVADSEFRREVMRAVARQCEVFVNG